MAIDFPANPTVGQTFAGPNGTFQWDGSKWTATPSSAFFLPLAGGTMTGPITLPGNATGPLQAVPLQQVPLGSVGRNLLHNSQFHIQQRGAGPWTAAGYTADRWMVGLISDTVSLSLPVLTDAERTAIGDDAAAWKLNNVFTGNAAAGAFNVLMQRLEDVRRLSNKTVIVSFWAVAGAPVNLGVSIDQTFGTGGSPSPPVNGNGQAVALTTTWARYSLAFVQPSISGKIGGTNGDSYTALNIWFSSGSTNAVRAGVGVQSGNVSLWGIQLEVAQPGQTQPSSLEKPDPRYDLDNCQRFYQIGNAQLAGYTLGGSSVTYRAPFPVTMRAAPTFLVNLVANTNITSVAMAAAADSYQFSGVGTANGTFNLAGTYTASADL